MDTTSAANTLNTWLAAISSRNIDKVVSLYADNAVLWGTFAQSLNRDREGIRDYFVNLLNPASVNVSVDELHHRELADDVAIANGSYTFELAETKDAEVRSVAARFSFVFQHTGGTWQIVDHHSSQFPAT